MAGGGRAVQGESLKALGRSLWLVSNPRLPPPFGGDSALIKGRLDYRVPNHLRRISDYPIQPGRKLRHIVDRLEHLREETADLVSKWVDVVDDLYGDPDAEPELDFGIEDEPHDQVAEGNDEPWLATGEDGNMASRAFTIDGELDASPEWEPVEP